MPLQDLRSWFAVGLAFLTPATLSAAPLPVIAERFEGEVMRDVGAAVQGLTPGQSFEPGTRIRTGADGRVEFSVQTVPTLKLGGRADLLLHSIDQNVLRAKLAGGALSVDTRARKGSKARDLRLNVGELRLRIQAAEAWVERSEQGSVVCLVSGSIDAQIADQPGRLDTPGQCLRHSGLTSMWSMVPQSVLAERLVLTQVRAREAIPVAPAPAPAPEPVPAPVVAMVPPAPPVVVAAPEPEPASERAPAATGVALGVPVAVQPPPIPPMPAPVVNPTMPAAGSAAIGTMAAVAVPEIPPEPVAVPNPRLPAATALALDVASAKSAPEVPPAPVAASPAKPETVTAASVPPVIAQAAAPSTPVTQTVSVTEVDSGADVVSAQVQAQAPKVEAEKVVLPAPAPAPGAVAAAPDTPALAGAEVPSATDGAPAAPVVAAAGATEAPVVAPSPSEQAMAPDEAAAVVVAESPASTPSHQPGAESGLDAEAAVALAMATAAAAEPIADDGRRWSVVLASFPLREPADKEVSRFKAMGFEAETREYRVGARHGFRVGVGRYTSRDEADMALAKMVALNPEIVGWLAKY